MEPRYFNCSNATLYPDGCVRCNFNGLVVNCNPPHCPCPCPQHSLGSVTVYKIKYEKPEVVKQKVRAELKPKAVKPVKIKGKASPQQRRLL